MESWKVLVLLCIGIVVPTQAYLTMSDINLIRYGRSYPPYMDQTPFQFQNHFYEPEPEGAALEEQKENETAPLIETSVLMSNPLYTWVKKVNRLYKVISPNRELDAEP
ncbi:unnamed protein product, partial [Mesorhabditis spiculigera]